MVDWKVNERHYVVKETEVMDFVKGTTTVKKRLFVDMDIVAVLMFLTIALGGLSIIAAAILL